MITNQFCPQLTLWISVALFIRTNSKWGMRSGLQVVKASTDVCVGLQIARGEQHTTDTIIRMR